MTEIIANIATLEWLAVIAGIAYVVLAAKENIWCWPFAFVGTAASMLMLWNVNLLMDSALNLFYLIMAVYGFWQWKYGGKAKSELKISTWSLANHLYALLAIVALSALFGYWLDNKTEAAWPYIDSATTWSAVVATFMVTRKVLENWLYWIVIDLVSVWIYIEREIYLYAVLFIVYTIIAIWGYINWKRVSLR